MTRAGSRRERARTVEPAVELATIESTIEMTAEARLALAEKGAPPLSSVPDVRGLLEHCRLPGSVLEGADLYIGLFRQGYGEYTIEEYDAAKRLKKDRLRYSRSEPPTRANAIRGCATSRSSSSTASTMTWGSSRSLPAPTTAFASSSTRVARA